MDDYSIPYSRLDVDATVTELLCLLLECYLFITVDRLMEIQGGMEVLITN